MRRRTFIYGGVGAGLAACAPADPRGVDMGSEQHRWRMVTSWPPNFPGFGESARRLAARIGELSDGRIEIEVFAAGELVPAFEVFDSVSRGTMQMAHSSPTYWRGIMPAAPLFSSRPFGMLPAEHHAWLYHGGGLELWRALYGARGVVPFVAGNTGAQMGGWFKRTIDSPEDFGGLKMRMSGLGGEVIQEAGAVAVSLPGAELFTSLQTGAIDATEWNGPFNDMAFGLHEVAGIYYYPGWHEPSGVLECLVARPVYDALAPGLQRVIDNACMAETGYVLAEFNARNQRALETLIEEHGIDVRPFPDSVLEALRGHTDTVMQRLSAGDADFGRVHAAYARYAASIGAFHEVSEGLYGRVRRA